jgi:type II secretory pathway pseudopilin PulG
MSMKKKNIKNKKGFSTLLVVILLGSVVMTLVFVLTTSSVWSIRSSIDTKNSNQAKSLVNACAEIALEKIREDNNFTGTNNNVVLSGNTCTYTVSNTGGINRNLTVSGTVNGITRNLNITTSSFNPLVISSWQENN